MHFREMLDRELHFKHHRYASVPFELRAPFLWAGTHQANKCALQYQYQRTFCPKPRALNK